MDEIHHLQNVNLGWPEPILDNLELLEGFKLDRNSVASVISCAPSELVSIKPSISFQDLHRQNQPSMTSLAMLRYLATSCLVQSQMRHMAHTDVGSLTLLFASSPGLETHSGNDY